MATTISNVTKSANSKSISGTTTKTLSNTVYTAVGPGNDYDTIYQNRVARDTFSGDAGSKAWTFTGLSLNTQYGLVAFAVGGGDSEISSVIDATLPAPGLSDVHISGVTATTVTVHYTTAADGGYYPKSIKYQLNSSGDFVTGATVASGSATSGEFTVSGLTPGTTYTISFRVSTTAGNTSSGIRSFTTVAVQQSKKKLYGSSNGLSTSVSDFYGSVSSQSRKATRLYGSIYENEAYIITPQDTKFGSVVSSIDGELLCAAVKSQAPSDYTRVASFTIYTTGGSFHAIAKDSNDVQICDITGSRTALAAAGITFTPVVIGGDQVSYLASYRASGHHAKLIHQGFGHLTYS